MEHKRKYFLRTEKIKNNALQFVKALPIDEKKPLVVDVKPITRNLEQNAKFHAMCGDIARQVQFNGEWLPLEAWKVLLISAHAEATKEGSRLVTGLEGELVNIRESTAEMSVKRKASLIEYTTAWGVSRGVHFNDRWNFGGVK
ncbi:recombination protein NinB [Glaesserella parasuis]|uniref:recombination protein NinB n=1 Tax=Glaesserella parasuis TaxID=738 RepID=UPI00131026AD|nr:recombination protein NinB [Glaesserella parasuis]MDG6325809.1 recombination protein NinB [Glaesserella parasuis]MDO9925111.1 recombination protein NinB [Glaesserella parasuis]MDP0054878.1 recombination protein NinB [Glaesserella parasuis]MDP0072175.1 recombination protein NinB [Glaesserella parasuis]MDP0097379.1 recombination protein NinB [Glaesserella parasuis]